MSTALIVTAGMGGNLPPLLGIGRTLEERGWRVIVHADLSIRDRVEAAGLEWRPAAGVVYDPMVDRSTIASLREIPRFFADRERGRDAVALAREVRADAVLVDVLFVGALAELEAAAMPTVVVSHSTWEGVRLWHGGALGSLTRLRGTAGLRSIARADLVVIASDGRLGRPTALPANARVTGPVLQELPSHNERRGRPLVLASLSTVAFPGQRRTLQHVLDALAELPVDAAVGSGASIDPAGLRAGANTVLSAAVDHAALMPEATVVLSHGGHATTVRALAHGLPMLFMPMHPMMDQPRIARAVEAAGAGLVVPRTASPERIRAAMELLLLEPRFAEAARRLGTDFVAAEGASTAADAIDSLVARHLTA